MFVPFWALGVAMVALILFRGITVEGAWEPTIVPVVIVSLVFILDPLMMIVLIKRRLRRMPAPGLYEGGFQLIPILFIPYPEIASTERRSASTILPEGIYLGLRFRPSVQL